MAHFVLTFLSRLARKLGMALLLASLALATYSLWLFGHERVGYPERRALAMQVIETESTSVRGQLAELNQRHAAIVLELETQQQRATQADKILKTIREHGAGALGRLFGDEDELKAHDDRIAQVESLKSKAQARAIELQREFVAGEAARAALAERLAWVEQEERALKKEKYPAEHYLRVAWNEARSLIIAVFIVYLVGDVVLAAILYYGWATWVSRGRPVQLATQGNASPVVSESAVVVDTTLWPGEVLWVRPRLLHAADDGLSRRTKFLLDWRAPLSCMAGGLSRMVELRNTRSDGERNVVFANGDDHFAELALVSVPEGGAFVLRAGFLMGLIVGREQAPVIRRHWRLFSWQSWVSGRFGYFEFSGPCRLLVSCVRALHADTLLARDDGKPVMRRVAQAGIIGFSPRVEFKPVRSEGFLRYCRGRAPLFDLHLVGPGVVLSREAAEGRSRDHLRIRLFKFLGL